MWSAITGRYTKALCGAHSHIGPQFAGSSKQGKCQQVGGHYYIPIHVMYLINKTSIIIYRAVVIGVLQDSAKKIFVNGNILVKPKYQFNAYWCCTGKEHINGLGK